MKKHLITLLIVAVSTIAFSQTTPITGVYGIPFGSSQETIISNMKAKGYTRDLTEKENLTFKKVKFGAFNNCHLVFYMFKNKLFQGLILMIPDLDAKIIDRYEDVVEELSRKYGEGEPFTKFKYPYEKGDGHELTAIKLGKAEYKTFWAKDEIGIITAYISSNLVVGVKYQDKNLIKEAVAEQNKSNTSEY
ncbi:hypothetical protein [Pedobacter caeni]|uniref:Uncharacterized protein n=1 Tax=Pedobacter caeni TaxID=288992 RepID=A0A1M5GVS5_9SPHI|nr:hypothetical protein [Pedobacter caeni]SHG07797.1 hypothetical protein SAMN04488522_104390 [Pedobacter caeni]